MSPTSYQTAPPRVGPTILPRDSGFASPKVTASALAGADGAGMAVFTSTRLAARLAVARGDRRQLDQAARRDPQPEQWQRLIERLGQAQNPKGPGKPSATSP